jgi:hypothetical protein
MKASLLHFLAKWPASIPEIREERIPLEIEMPVARGGHRLRPEDRSFALEVGVKPDQEED